MAKIVEQKEYRQRSEYEKWFDGKVWEIGMEDAVGEVKSIRHLQISILTTATSLGLIVRTKRVGEGKSRLQIQAVTPLIKGVKQDGPPTLPGRFRRGKKYQNNVAEGGDE